MTNLQQHLIDTVKYLDGLGLKTFLIGSTLLQLVRTGEFNERHIADRELNIGCLAEDLTQEILDKIKADNPYFNVIGDDSRKAVLVFFSSPTNDNWTDHWQMEPGFTLLVPFFKEEMKEELRVEYLGDGHHLAWPAYQLESFKTVRYKGVDFRGPCLPHNWLNLYFGKDWKKENLKWSWGMARNLDWKGGWLE